MPSRLPRSLIVSVVVAAALLAVALWSRDSVAVGDLEVAETQELDLPFGDAYLAPNGERIAVYAEEELCVYTADGEEERCVDDPTSLDPNSVRWNPDGSRLLFTENFYQYFDEPDIWLLDADSGEVTNLTDDGVEEGGLDIEESGADVDVSPEWVDDGSTVRFLRWHQDDDAVDVMELPADGGEPEQVGVLATDSAPGLISYSPDGERAAYARMAEEDTVVADLDGENVETIADGTSYMPAFSPDGESVLAMPLYGGYDPSEVPPTRVVPVDGGEATELDRLRWAAWRTGGKGLATAEVGVEENVGQVTMRIGEDADDEGHEVGEGTYLPPYRGATWLPPVWSEQDTILLMELVEGDEDEGNDFRYVLLHLG
jgi:dipeptidyl aminopeptidase/acylaminoacyl peptidase